MAAFRARAAGRAAIGFDEFMELALYHPELGYYRRDRGRVGRGPDTDFYTASSSAPLFGELIAAAAVKLLGDSSARETTFVEIGAEPGRSVLEGVAHSFASVRSIRVGEEIHLAGRCVVFSNELFDAQPFRRFVFREGRWIELGVSEENGRLLEAPLAQRPPLLYTLPAQAAEGYVIDAPFAAVELLRRIASQPWTGLFLALDYGKTWTELTRDQPAGTARAYSLHRQSNELLDQPGHQDLTCHVCWDWLEEALQQSNFERIATESQESFLVHHAGGFIQQTIAADAQKLTTRKQSLQQLLHPSHLGQKFQALHGLRRVNR